MKKKLQSSYCTLVLASVIVICFLILRGANNRPIGRIKKIEIADTEYKYDVLQRRQIRNLIMKQTHPGLSKKGIISIPSIKILLPVFNSAYSKSGLKAGANFANKSEVDPYGKSQVKLGKGNVGIAAHNFNDGKTAFSALQQNKNRDYPYIYHHHILVNNWLNGNLVYVANANGIYVYKISRQELVSKYDVSILNTTKVPQLTLITCLYPNDHYKIVTKAFLIKKYNWQTAPDKAICPVDLMHKKTNAHVFWWNPGKEEGNQRR